MTDLRALKDQATQLARKGKFPAALEAWKRAAAAAPHDLAVVQKVADLSVKVGQKAEAVRLYEDVAKRYAEQGLFFKASATCRVLLSVEPGHQRTQELIASLFARGRAKPAPAAPPPEPEFDIEIELEVDPPPTASGLPSIPLFSTLSREELQEVLAHAMEVRAFAPGEVIVTEGEPGDSMFALAEGTASVMRGWGTPEARKVASVATGDVFGETAMVSGAPRLATVVADGDAVALQFPRAAVQKVIDRHPPVAQALERFYRQRLLANILRASPILRALPEDEKAALAGKFQAVVFSDGDRIITEGQPAQNVYLLMRGSCAVTHQSGARYPDLHEGDLFGEVAALQGGGATATVVALGQALALEVSAPEFFGRISKYEAAMQAVHVLVQRRLTRTAELDGDSRA